MAKILKHENISEGKKYHHDQYFYFCKGCGCTHCFALNTEGGHHSFNEDYEKPTVSPSLFQNWNKDRICHSFMRDGMIEYLGDCWHDLRGQTIELPEILDINQRPEC